MYNLYIVPCHDFLYPFIPFYSLCRLFCAVSHFVCVVVSVHGLVLSLLIRRLFAFCRLCAVMRGKSCGISPCLSLPCLVSFSCLALLALSLLAHCLVLFPWLVFSALYFPIRSRCKRIPGMYHCTNTFIQSDLYLFSYTHPGVSYFILTLCQSTLVVYELINRVK